MKSGTLLSKIARCTKPHVVKSTDLHCILNTNINKCRGEKPTKRKNCHILPSAMYSSYHAGAVLKAESTWDEPCDSFTSLLRAI